MTLRGTVRLLVVVPVAVAVVLAGVGLAGRLTARAAADQVLTRIEPARVAAGGLVTALVDQESGSRGYLLTGDPRFLEPYRNGVAAAGAAQAQLTALLADDPAGLAALGTAATAATQWRVQTAEPQMAARQSGSAGDVEAGAVQGKEQFDRFRAASAALEAHLVDRETTTLTTMSSARAWTDGITYGALAVALGVAALAPLVIRRRLTDPVDRLQRQARAVAGGQEQLPIAVDSPAELAAIAGDADVMRRSLLARRDDAVEAQLELALRDTRDTLAAEVHDHTVQRLFALGLALDALGTTVEPRVAARLTPLVDELDEAVRELRALIFGLVRTSVTGPTLRDALFDLVRDSTRALGFTPALGIHGDVAGTLGNDTAIDLLTVLREALSNIARHARATSASVRLAVDRQTVALRVVDDGVGPSPSDEVPRGRGIDTMSARAVRHGGTLCVRAGEASGTVLEWAVPTEAARPARLDARPRTPDVSGAPLEG
ncbi:CHASE3 domain-containing protein [Actinomycetospora sp. TBRC 11914]|uniref:CHASE3 domain-containing protein n=1 Tax=Actinomycetospora sp. TBRC 11914 TaxID=2729387 RepID=UPI00145F462C|nr:CHASE3 domain-containing protein [Actinomycetospora sp. TBRC 11914]NMO94084.1 HAMP domain-containing protein [Actinomycetospora sp. TBRC 11914]